MTYRQLLQLKCNQFVNNGSSWVEKGEIIIEESSYDNLDLSASSRWVFFL